MRANWGWKWHLGVWHGPGYWISCGLWVLILPVRQPHWKKYRKFGRNQNTFQCTFFFYFLPCFLWIDEKRSIIYWLFVVLKWLYRNRWLLNWSLFWTLQSGMLQVSLKTMPNLCLVPKLMGILSFMQKIPCLVQCMLALSFGAVLLLVIESVFN